MAEFIEQHSDPENIDIWMEGYGVHIERMDDKSIWIGVYKRGFQSRRRQGIAHIWLTSKERIEHNIWRND